MLTSFGGKQFPFLKTILIKTRRPQLYRGCSHKASPERESERSGGSGKPRSVSAFQNFSRASRAARA